MSIWFLFLAGYVLTGLVCGIAAEINEERRRARWRVKHPPGTYVADTSEKPWKSMGVFWFMFLGWPLVLPVILGIGFHNRVEKMTKKLARVDRIPEVAAKKLEKMEKEVDL